MASPSKRTIFMTGAHGYIGTAVTELALAAGYRVVGLSRGLESDAKLQVLGVEPVRGTIFDHAVLTRESAAADAVINLADAWRDRLEQEYSDLGKLSDGVTDAIAAGLRGSNKPLICASGSALVAADPDGNETAEDAPPGPHPCEIRLACERHALDTASQGVRACSVRLAPWVYGRGGSGVALFMGMFAPAGEITYVNEGAAHTTTVHVEDAARAIMLVLDKGRAGHAYNVTHETNVTFKQLAEAMAQITGLPARSKPYQELAKLPRMAFVAMFLSIENRGSNAKARRELGWEPTCKGILEDITAGSYVEIGKKFKKA